MPVLEQAGHAIGYREAGPADAPLVVFAHCSLGHSGLWKGVFAELSASWRCIATDLPGHGATDRGDQAISLQDQAAEDVVAIIDAFGDGPTHLVGLSLGGAIMGRTAIRHARVARTLTMIEPIWMQLLTESHPEMAEANHASMKGCYEACAEGRYEDGARAFMESWGQPGQFDKFPDASKRAVGAALRWIQQDFPMAHTWAPGQVTREEIAAIDIPVLLMQAELTQPSAKAVVSEVSALLPSAPVREVASAGHLSPVDDPKAVAGLLRAFLQE